MQKNIKRKVIISILVVFIFIICGFSFAQGDSLSNIFIVQDTTNLKKLEANEKAKEIFKTVAFDANPTNVDYGLDSFKSKNVWKVNFDNLGEVILNETMDDVLFFINQDWHEKRNKNQKNIDKNTFIINDQNVEEKADKHIKDLNVKKSGKLLEKKLVENEGNIIGNTYWYLKWVRELNGYKFNEDFIIMGIDPVDGTLVAYNNHFFSNNPTSLELNLTFDEAIKSAQNTAEQNMLNLSIKKPELIIVNPNFQWTSNFSPESNPNTRLAWVIKYNKDYGENEIWVDAQNGEILGGIKIK